MQEKNTNVLLIEDDPEDTLLLMELMSQPSWPWFRFTLVCADNLKAGLERLSEGKTDVVLLDISLPDSRGLETVLKVHSKAPDLPIVVLTGLRDEALGLDAVTHGAQDFLVKGAIDGHVLKRTIAYAVERHRLAASVKEIVDRSADAMVVIDAKGIVSYVNPSAQTLFARGGEQVVGKPFPYAIPREGQGNIRISSDNGSERIADMRVTKIEWKDQEAHLASIRDITDLRRLEQLKAEIQERRRVDQLKDQLMDTVSHQMRTPMTIVNAGVDFLQDDLVGVLTDKQSALLEVIHQNVRRALKVMGNILEMSRLESGKIHIQCRRVDAVRLIRRLVEGFQLLATERNISIADHLPDHLPAVYADPDLFGQVFENLLDNAVRFAKSSVEIRANLADEDQPSGRTVGGRDEAVLTRRPYLQFSVIDDGPGVPKDQVRDLFNKFVQVRRAQGTGYKGTGLGLAISKEMIERQQGRIWAEAGDGGGRFHFTVPRYEPGAEARRIKE